MKAILLSLALALSLAAAAQPGPPAGRGPGSGCGPGAGPCFGADNTPGWSMMTPEERTQHQQKMRGMKSHDECMAYMDKQHAEMQARAKERGKTLPANPGAARGCDYLQKR